MNRSLLLAILVLLPFSPIAAEQRIGIAVLDLDPQVVTPGTAGVISELVRGELAKSDKVSLVEKGRMEAILKEQAFEMTGCVELKCAAKAGTILKVDKMIIGSLGSLGKKYILTLKVVDVRTAQNEATISQKQIVDIENLDQLVKPAVDSLIPKIKLTVPTTGNLTVLSTPPGAEVTLKGQIQGITPLESPPLDPGEYVIGISKAGYRPIERPVTIVAGKTEILNVSLEEQVTKGTLRVTSQPSGATVYLDGVRKGLTTEDGLLIGDLALRSYRLKVAAPDYGVYEDKVTPLADSILGVKAVLPSKPGSLLVRSTPSGAAVSIDDEPQGRTPCTVPLGPGNYTLSLEKEGYEEYAVEVKVLPGRTVLKHAVLRKPRFPKPGLLVVRSTPSGATVSVDGEPKYKTPCTIPGLAAGKHTLKVEKEGYDELTTEVVVADGRSVTRNVDLTSKFGSLAVASTPPGAVVSLDGQPRGNTPCTITGLSPGKYALKLEKDGFETDSREVTVAAGRPTPRTVVLTSKFGSLVVTSTPSGATVSLDGQPRGTTPRTIPGLSPGEYTLAIEKNGYEEFSSRVTVKAGPLQRQPVVLKRIPVVKPGTLVVRSTPSAASVSLNGYPKGSTPCTITGVPPGTYTLKVEREDYEPSNAEVTVVAGRSQARQVLLKIKPATLVVRSTPPGASVFLDDEPKDVTPCTISGLSPGRRTLKVHKAGYSEYAAEVALAPGDSVVREVSLTIKPAKLLVMSNPTGASLFLDDRPRGTTPCTLAGLAPGSYALKLKMEGCDEYTGTVTLAAGDSILRNVALKTHPGSLEVRSSPSGATVSLDEQPRGVTPCMISKLTPGNYALKVQKEGYGETTSSVTVLPGRTLNQTVTLKKQAGSVRITSQPARASVYLDGATKGTTASDGLLLRDLAVRSYQLKVAAPGCEPYEAPVTPVADSTIEVKVDLTSKPSLLVILSTPPGASVFLDEQPKGTTPCTLAERSSGRRALKIKKEGFETRTAEVTLVAGGTVTKEMALKETKASPFSTPGGTGETMLGAGFTYLRTNAQGYREYLNEKDGSTLIEVPAGSFTMGLEYLNEAKPEHAVELGKYYIAKAEVTVDQFRKFASATGYQTSSGMEAANWRFPGFSQSEDCPVVFVSYSDAKAYCDWAGLRLPTEAEWEKAARGADNRKYPWGNQWKASTCNGKGGEDGYPNTAPAGRLSGDASPYGVQDMAGNASEWCADWYDPGYYASSPASDPRGPSSGGQRVVRGGSWESGSFDCQAAVRLGLEPKTAKGNLGFRLAK